MKTTAAACVRAMPIEEGLVSGPGVQPASLYCTSAPSLVHFLRGRKKRCAICSRMREIPRKSWEFGYAWIFSVYLIVVFRYISAYVQRMPTDKLARHVCVTVYERQPRATIACIRVRAALDRPRRAC